MKNYILILFLTLLFSSCENMLQEVPQNFISKSNFYQTEEDAQAALNGVYNSLLPDYYFIHGWLLEVGHSDYVKYSADWSTLTTYDIKFDQRELNLVLSVWNRYYTTVNRANSVLDNVGNMENISSSVRDRIMAEAYFLRANVYFDLARNYGAVPLKLHESRNLDELAVPREPVGNIYDQIISDLLIAENNLPASVGENTGQASKWAAKMLLADIYLTIGEYSMAAEKADEVINSGLYSLVEIDTPNDFYKIFGPNTSSEDIMSIHNSENSPGMVPRFIHIANALPWNPGPGYQVILPDTSTWIGSAWDTSDLRKQFCFYDEYQTPNSEWIPVSGDSPWRFKKFIKNENNQEVYNVPRYRFAEALLFYAEASAMANGTPSALALERLNMVKRRGYGLDPNMSSAVDYPSGMSNEEFQEVVLQERGYEFILERKRWHDLKRTGTLKEAFAKAGKNYIDERILWPLPQDEINNNDAISQADQNPGY
jgi:starch-binding outer membrane protein, SusD/RagB family